MLTMEEKDDIRVEVEESSVTIVFPRKMDHLAIRWEEAYRLGAMLESASYDVPHPPIILDPVRLSEEIHKFKFNTHKDRDVVLFFEWTDRITLTPLAARHVANEIKRQAQDLDLLRNNRVRMVYVHGRPLAHWEWVTNWYRKFFGPRK